MPKFRILTCPYMYWSLKYSRYGCCVVAENSWEGVMYLCLSCREILFSAV
jgi:hypothetical protein